MKDIKKTPSWSKLVAARDAFARVSGPKAKASAKEKQAAKTAYAQAAAQCIQEAEQPKAPELKMPLPRRAGVR